MGKESSAGRAFGLVLQRNSGCTAKRASSRNHWF